MNRSINVIFDECQVVDQIGDIAVDQLKFECVCSEFA